MKSKLILKDNKLFKVTPINLGTFDKNNDDIDPANNMSALISNEEENKTMIYYILKNQEEINHNVSIMTKIIIFLFVLNLISIIASIVLSLK